MLKVSKGVIAIVFGVPESPRWLYYHNRPEEARKAISDVWDVSPDHPSVIAQEQEIMSAIELESSNGQYGWMQLFKKDEVQTGKRVLLAWGMQFMNQLCGINLIV